MKNKVRLIDITVVSEYMGRFLTAIVSIVVIAITISALMSEGGLGGQPPLVVGVSPSLGAETAENHYRHLKFLLEQESGRRVEIVEIGRDWCDRCDICVLALAEFIRAGDERNLVPLYAVSATTSGADAAVVVARAGDAKRKVPDPGNVLFVDPMSVNGCWLQLAQMEAHGFSSPDSVAALRFVPTPSADRVVFSVLAGVSVYGACRQSDVNRLVAAGSVVREELEVVFSNPALPEHIIACHPQDADYYRGVLSRTSGKIAGVTSTHSGRIEPFESSGIRSLRPVSPEEMARAAELFERMGNRI